MRTHIHTIGRNLTPELRDWLAALRERVIVSAHASTADFVRSARLIQTAGQYEVFAPSAIVWLQSRPGEFRQAEIDAAIIADPLARPFLVAGTLCEGEPRSGKLLAEVSRIYWHQGVAPLLRQLSAPSPFAISTAAPWVAIHVPRLTDYQGLSGLCQSLGHKSIWQEPQRPAISSEPDIRLFWGWPAWEEWQTTERTGQSDSAARSILVLDFPRHADFVRAKREDIQHVLATPCSRDDLSAALRTTQQPAAQRVSAQTVGRSATKSYRRSA